MNKAKKKKEVLLTTESPISTIKIGHTTYEVTTTFNGNQNRDMKSTLLRLMIQDLRKSPIKNLSDQHNLTGSIQPENLTPPNTLPKSG